MWWMVLAALGNRWIWLFSAFAAVALLALGQPAALAVGAGATVLLGGAFAQGASDWHSAKQARGITDGARRGQPLSGKVRDPDALRQIARADAAVARQQQAPANGLSGELDIGVRSEQTLAELHHTGLQVDRLSAALASVDLERLQHELTEVRRALGQPDAAEDLVHERRRTEAGLAGQLATVNRIVQQRAVLLERMRATAVGLESVSVRWGEIAALSASQGEVSTAAEDLGALSVELDDLRQGLVEAAVQVRRALAEDPIDLED